MENIIKYNYSKVVQQKNFLIYIFVHFSRIFSTILKWDSITKKMHQYEISQFTCFPLNFEPLLRTLEDICFFIKMVTLDK